MKELRDAALKATLALPNGAAATTMNPSIDTGVAAGAAGAGVLGGQEGTPEFIITAPAMTVSQQPNGKTIKYDVVCADDAALTVNPVTYITAALTQTGANGTGAATATFRFRIPSTAKRFVGLIATGSTAGDASGSTASLEMLI